MTKKQYIIKILNKLRPTRELAGGLAILVEKGDLDNKLINQLFDILKKIVHKTYTKIQSQKVQKSIELIEKMKHQEMDSRVDQNLENMLNDI